MKDTGKQDKGLRMEFQHFHAAILAFQLQLTPTPFKNLTQYLSTLLPQYPLLSRQPGMSFFYWFI
jgi:hypothetical protein